MGRTALKITLAVAMAAGLLLGVSGSHISALFIQRRTWTLCRIRNGSY